MPTGEKEGVERLGEGAHLVHFHEHGIRHALFNTLGDSFDLGAEEVVAYQLQAVTQAAGEELPARPVVLGQAVLDGDQGWDLAGPLFEAVDQARAVEGETGVGLEVVAVGLGIEKVRGRDIERQGDVRAGVQAERFR